MKFRKLTRDQSRDAFRQVPSYFPSDYPTQCVWCGEKRLDEDEESHLAACKVFNSLPVTKVSADGRTFILLPGSDSIFVERYKKS